MKVSSYGLAGIATAAILIVSTPALSADIAVAPEPVLEDGNFWYVSIHGGVKFGEDWHDKDTEQDFDADLGWRLGGALGYSLTTILSLESELSYLNQELELDTDPSPDCCDDSDLSIVTGMFNLIAAVPDSIVRPYLGAGIGLAQVSFDFELEDGDIVFAAQGLAGADIVLTWFAIGARYRFVHLSDLELTDEGGNEHDLDPELMQSVEAVLTIGF